MKRAFDLASALALLAGAGSAVQMAAALHSLQTNGIKHRGKGRGSINWDHGNRGTHFKANGEQECARRRRQTLRGELNKHNGLGKLAPPEKGSNTTERILR